MMHGRHAGQGIVIGLALLAGGVTPAAWAQETIAPVFNGRDFGGLLFELPAQQGGLTFSASKTTVWSEAGAMAPGSGGRTLGGVVQRMYLRGDVRARVGTSDFKAARAVVWLERLDDMNGQTVHQVAVYFDRVGNPNARAGTGQTGDRLLVTARVVGSLILASDATPMEGQGLEEDAFVHEAHARMSRYLAGVEAATTPGAATVEQAPLTPSRDPLPFKKYKPGVSQPYEPGSVLGHDGPRIPASALSKVSGQPFSGTMGDDRLFSSRGVLTVAAGQIALSEGAEENHLVVTGGVVLQWSEPSRDRSLQLTGQNAVVFLKPGKLTDFGRFTADNVLGVYLEGDVVATDNRFTLRAPHVYYDVQNNQAYTVDAVFWTYDEQRGLPLYIRAESIRQSTRNSVTATGVKIAASSFYDPILSLGASSVTVRREPRSGAGGERVIIESTGISPRVLGLPFAWLPKYRGEVQRFALRDVGFENSSGSGAGVKTRWDFFGLTGIEPAPGLELDILADGWLKRGVGLGADMRWDNPDGDNRGSLFGYIVPSDSGTDVLTSGVRVNRDDETRGMALYEQRLVMDGGWTAMLEGSYISDENFVDAYYESLAESRREFATSATLRHVNDNATFAATIKGNLNDFTPNEYLLQSQGYTVAKLPEVSYHRVADDLFSGRWPGAFHYTSEYRLGQVQFDFVDPTAAELGYPTAGAAAAAFGFAAPTDSWATVLGGMGLHEDAVTRFDTRHEIDWNLKYGPVRITPFAVGRVTAYDDDFAPLATPGSDEEIRWWAAGGVRASTQVQRVYENAESSFLDIHKLRHIIEPSVAFWSAGTNRRSETLPVYDDEVEGIVEGTAVRVGLSQTLQTQRGRAMDGTGGRVVDLLRLNIDYVHATDDTNRTSPLGDWYDARPEESQLGQYVKTDAALLLTDATTLTFGNTYDFDIHQPAKTTVGVGIEHSEDFKTFAELRFLNARNTTYVDLGMDYRLTSKYTVASGATYDTNQGEFQDVGVRINREFPDVTFSVRVRYNNITGETTTGVVVTPLGRNRREENMRRLGRDQYLDIEPQPAPVERGSFP